MLHHISVREKIVVMAAVLTTMLLAALDQSIVGTALPRIVGDFHALSELSWVVTAYLLTSTIAIPIAGKLSDIYGRRKLLIIGILTFVGGSMLTGMSWNIGSLIAFRAFQGIGGGIIFACAIAVIGDLFAPAERARWQGLFGAVFGLASVIGPLLGGWLTDNASWRWCFYINVPVGLAALYMIYRYLPTIIGDKKPSIDYRGAFLLTFGLTALLLGFSWGGTKFAWGSWQIVSLLVAAAGLLAGFIYAEHKAKDPIMPLALFKNKIFRPSIAIIFLTGFAMFGAIIYIPLFAQLVQGASATNSGIILLPMVIALTATSLLNGQLVSRTGRYKVLAIIGAFLTTASILWLATLKVDSTHVGLVLRIALLGVGIGILMPLFNLIIQNAFDQKLLGVASASTQLFRSIGSTIGVAIMGTYLNHSLANNLGGLQENTFVKASAQAGHPLSSLDANSLQPIISKEGQAATLHQFANLPADALNQLTNSFHIFVAHAQAALASSISGVFLISGLVLSIACVLVFFVKEIPLKRGTQKAPVDM